MFPLSNLTPALSLPSQTSILAPAPGLPLGLMLVIAVLGLIFLLWFFRRPAAGRTDGESHCGKCGYIVRGLTTFTCPECGSDLRDVGIAAAAGKRQGSRLGGNLTLQAMWACKGKLALWTILLLVGALAVTAPVHFYLWPHQVQHSFVLNLTPQSGLYSVRLDSQGLATVRGALGINAARPVERRLNLHLTSGLNQPLLSMDYVALRHFYHTWGNQPVNVAGPITRQSMDDYLKNAGVDVTRPEVQAESQGLVDVFTALGKDPHFSLHNASRLLTLPGGPFAITRGSGWIGDGPIEPQLTEMAAIPFWGMIWLACGAVIVLKKRKRLRADAPAAAPLDAVPAWPPSAHGIATARTLSIMFTDIKDYTARSAAESRLGVVEMVRRHRELAQPIVRRRGGRIVKTIGDALLITFQSATDAVLGGVEIQQAVLRHNQSVFTEREKLELRIAISTGEVAEEANDVYGEAVNLASRVQQLGEPGQVLFTESTLATVNKREVKYAEQGTFELKGIDGPVRVFRAEAG